MQLLRERLSDEIMKSRRVHGMVGWEFRIGNLQTKNSGDTLNITHETVFL